jgi:hypothetical protein
MTLRQTALLLCLVLPPCAFGQATSASPKPSFEDALLANRYELHLDPSTQRLSGPGSLVLQKAIADANFVFLGEDHITHEIPQFASAVCDLMAPSGLTGLAVEASPDAAAFIQSVLSSPHRAAIVKKHMQQYPNAIAFLDVREEEDLAAHCASVSRNPSFHLWGLDQAFVGSAGWLLDSILATHPGPHATAAIEHLKLEEQSGAASARQDPAAMGKLLLFAITADEIANTRALLQREGSAQAQSLFQELIDSHIIYSLNTQGSPESNTLRTRLLKQTLQHDLDSLAASHTPIHLLLKFGDWHGYKGVNPLHQRDLGNFVAEFADSHNLQSVHIIVLGAEGTHRIFTGYDKPTQTQPFVMTDDSDYTWMKPLFANQLANAWTLVDLRNLRFGKQRPADPDMQRLVDGYDLLVMIPQLTPATLLEEQP